MGKEDPYQEMARFAVEQHKQIMFYADHKLLKAGDYAEVATNMARRARMTAWASGFILIGFGQSGVRDFIRYGESAETPDLVLGIFQIGLTLFLVMGFLFNYLHLRKTKDWVLELMARSQKDAGSDES
jgi:hypothetical protein